jgi:hypothetical protein
MKNRITVMLAILADRRKLRWCYVEEKEFFGSKTFWWDCI